MRPAWLRRGDLATACAVLITALLAAFFLWSGQAPASQVSVQYPDGTIALYALHTDRTLTVDGKQDIQLTVDIADGRVRVRESACPDQVCVACGWLSKSGQTAACIPAGVCVRIVGSDSTVDGVTS